MTLLIRFLLLALCAISRAEQLGDWTLENFGRYCDQYGSLCVYHFSIVEDNFSEASPRMTMPCTFAVQAGGGRPANQTDFQDMSCAPSMPSMAYRVNGGWDSTGFIIIVVTNVDDNAYAFFGYQDVDLENGKLVEMETRPAFVVGTFGGSPSITPRGTDESTTFWQILGLQRQHTTSESVILMEFGVRQNDGLIDHCTILVQAPDGLSAQTFSFYEQKCEDSGWYISWGYGAGDTAVMTVVSSDKSMNAWFGFEHVNEREYLSDSGPSPVYPCKCG